MGAGIAGHLRCLPLPHERDARPVTLAGGPCPGGGMAPRTEIQTSCRAGFPLRVDVQRLPVGALRWRFCTSWR
ncbi:MAG: hypothetical protein MZV64_17865 [Ignavibacteriales bacterium]|nr:hypothetical protein [Ignavibacteriales bacterium]